MDSTYTLTAKLDQISFAWLDDLRRRYFPPERNFLPAHLTLFHRLSSAQTARLHELRLPVEPLGVSFDAPLLLGSGVAIRVRSPDLEALRTGARVAIGGDFSAQDSQGWRPHVTVQNKVPGDAARQLHSGLAHTFESRGGAVTGLLVWKYLGGPWKQIQYLPFE